MPVKRVQTRNQTQTTARPLTTKTLRGDMLIVEFVNGERETFVRFNQVNPSHATGVLTFHDGLWWWARR